MIDMAEDLTQPKNLSPEWLRLIKLVERLRFGEIRLIVQQGKPQRIEIAVKQVKLDQPIEESGPEVMGVVEL